MPQLFDTMPASWFARRSAATNDPNPRLLASTSTILQFWHTAWTASRSSAISTSHFCFTAELVAAPRLTFWKHDAVTVCEHCGSTGRPKVVLYRVRSEYADE